MGCYLFPEELGQRGLQRRRHLAPKLLLVLSLVAVRYRRYPGSSINHPAYSIHHPTQEEKVCRLRSRGYRCRPCEEDRHFPRCFRDQRGAQGGHHQLRLPGLRCRCREPDIRYQGCQRVRLFLEGIEGRRQD